MGAPLVTNRKKQLACAELPNAVKGACPEAKAQAAKFLTAYLAIVRAVNATAKAGSLAGNFRVLHHCATTSHLWQVWHQGISCSSNTSHMMIWLRTVTCKELKGSKHEPVILVFLALSGLRKPYKASQEHQHCHCMSTIRSIRCPDKLPPCPAGSRGCSPNSLLSSSCASAARRHAKQKRVSDVSCTMGSLAGAMGGLHVRPWRSALDSGPYNHCLSALKISYRPSVPSSWSGTLQVMSEVSSRGCSETKHS